MEDSIKITGEWVESTNYNQETLKKIIELTGYSFGYVSYYNNPLYSLIIEIGSDALIRLFTFGYDTFKNYYEYGYWWWSEPIKCKIDQIPHTEQNFKTKIKNNWD